MFDWLKTTNATNFGESIARSLIELVPLVVANGDSSKRQSKANYARDKLQKRIREFKQREVLNVLKSAKLLNSFKWTLKDAGYNSEFIEEFAQWLFKCLRN